MKMEYAKVSNGEVLKIGSLPSSLAGKSKEELLKLGWYEVHNTEVTAKEWQFLVYQGIEIKKDYVLRKFKVENISLDEFKTKKIQVLKHNAYTIITAHYPLYKQINSALGIYTDEEIQEIKNVIQAVRNEYHKKKDIIENASDYNEIEKVITRIEYFDKDKQINENTIPEGEN